LCMILIDLDHFKQINDRLGHQAGDLVLRRVADTLQDTVRTEDVLARFGGEEFALIARGIDVAGARMFAERVRMLIEKLDVRFGEEWVRVTGSLGVAHTQTCPSATTQDTFVAAADGALYGAKKAGKNCVSFATGEGRYTVAASGEGDARDGLRRRRETATIHIDPNSDLLRNGRR
jgi:two-component system cell cycle response regulator